MNSDLLPFEDTNVQDEKWGCSRLELIFLERESSFSLGFDRLDRRFSTEQEGKLFYTARTTRGHRFGGVPTTPRGRDLFLLVLIFV